ncbi:MAG: RdgB/HAM1 family non-canonical purine NTP pyrophosphatase [Verrucomicrobiota bacterium]
MSEQLVIASGNAHKVEEFGDLLAGLGFSVVSAKAFGGMPDVVEDGETFEANAEIKARALRQQVPDEVWVLADDSGLEVDYLDGAPGIYSARYAGADADDAANRVKLLQALDGVEVSERSARFRCVLCVLKPDGERLFFDGSCDGCIASSEQGDMGFGYDSIFIPAGHERTFGQLGDAVKRVLSHRAKAVSAFRGFFA